MNYYLFLVYMHMNQTPKRHRFPVSIISHASIYIIDLTIVIVTYKNKWHIEE